MPKNKKVPDAPEREVKFSNLEKIFFPKTKFTKGEMIHYYLQAAPAILPHLRDRPITTIRFTDGITGERFYEKNAPRFRPSWIKTFSVPRRHHEGEIDYLLINDAETLAWCANMAAMELHPFLHRVPKLDCPTHVVFDLDPGEGADLLTCIRVAFLIKEITDGLKLEIFPKVSGSKGLQIYLPLNTAATYEETGAFAKAVAELLAKQQPKLVVSAMPKELRRGKVLIDWSQNSRSKTTVSVYSMRGKRDEPYISMPVTWEEFKKAERSKKTDALFFSPDAAVKRLEKKGDLFAPVLVLKQKLPRAFARQSPAVDPPENSKQKLAAYEAKRDFTKTAEPSSTGRRKGRQAKNARSNDANGGSRFVIQKHAASHLHYDFRLEMDGTLKSWAIPKGVPTELGVKRSAFAVEDHPLDYMRFEGTIPKGQYGGGTVMVWDIGTYELLSGSVESGSLKLLLRGKKLKGEWHMFKIRSDDGKDVWLIAKSGRPATAISPRRDDMSVLSHRSMARIAKDNDAQWTSHR
ncbi:MAG: non-homologous end-joining DNA ligase [Nibricoccus sp.]